LFFDYVCDTGVAIISIKNEKILLIIFSIVKGGGEDGLVISSWGGISLPPHNVKKTISL
jgi:hypothetical protein